MNLRNVHNNVEIFPSGFLRLLLRVLTFFVKILTKTVWGSVVVGQPDSMASFALIFPSNCPLTQRDWFLWHIGRNWTNLALEVSE